MNQRNRYHNIDEPPSTSFLASDGGGYRYAAYEDDYLYDNNNMNRNINIGNMGDMDGENRNMNDYGKIEFVRQLR